MATVSRWALRMITFPCESPLQSSQSVRGERGAAKDSDRLGAMDGRSSPSPRKSASNSESLQSGSLVCARPAGPALIKHRFRRLQRVRGCLISEVKVATDVHGPSEDGPVQTSMRLAQYLQYPGEYLSS